MSPTPSSASKANRKKKKKNGKRNEQEKEEEKKLADEFRATTLGQKYGVTDDQMGAGCKEVLKTPDNPPCDGCSTPFSGTMQCSRCESVFYCGRECQVSHWNAAHKDECAKLKQRNKETAKRILENFKEIQDWRELDVAGAYNAAVRQGLHDKIREVMVFDKTEIFQRFRKSRGDDFISYVHSVLLFLFRGKRGEGRAEARSPGVNCIDVTRVKEYVWSHPDALDGWLQASVQLLRAVTNRAMLRKPLFYGSLLVAAEEIWAVWSNVFDRSSTARAVLMPFPSPACDATGDDGDSSEHRQKREEIHALRIAEAVAEAHRLVARLWDVPPFGRVLHLLETQTVSVAGKILLRTKEYGMNVDVEGMLNLQGQKKELFQHFLLPLAERAIKNGGEMSAQELNVAMAKASESMDLHNRIG